MFALLGMRALFVLVESLVARFRYLDETIAIVLGLVGVKLLIEDLVKVGPVASLADHRGRVHGRASCCRSAPTAATRTPREHRRERAEAMRQGGEFQHEERRRPPRARSAPAARSRRSAGRARSARPPTATCSAKPGGSRTRAILLVRRSGRAPAGDTSSGRRTRGSAPRAPVALRWMWPATIRLTCGLRASSSPRATRSASARPIASSPPTPVSDRRMVHGQHGRRLAVRGSSRLEPAPVAPGRGRRRPGPGSVGVARDQPQRRRPRCEYCKRLAGGARERPRWARSRRRRRGCRPARGPASRAARAARQRARTRRPSRARSGRRSAAPRPARVQRGDRAHRCRQRLRRAASPGPIVRWGSLIWARTVTRPARCASRAGRRSRADRRRRRRPPPSAGAARSGCAPARPAPRAR